MQIQTLDCKKILKKPA